MKKMFASVLCTLLLFSSLATASAGRIYATPVVRSGAGINNTYYATASLSKKNGYYSSVSLTLIGTYRFYQSVQQYQTSDTASSSSNNPSEDVSATARVFPSRVEDTPLSHSVQNIIGYYRN